MMVAVIVVVVAVMIVTVPVAVVVTLPVVVRLVMVMRISRTVLVHAELGRRDARPEHLLGGDVPPQAAQRVLQPLEREPGVEERAERHVAGDAGKTIEIQQPHSAPISFRLQYRVSPRMM